MDLKGSDSTIAAAPPGGWPIPSAAYIHVPFCRHRCGYCNFSVVAQRDDLIQRFLNAIDNELKLLDRPVVETVYLGGGTPTHLADPHLGRLLEIIADRFHFEGPIEWSVEGNPEDIDPPKLQLLASFGVNRISLGVQSFDDQKLSSLDRMHTGRLAQEAVEMSAARFANVSIDLIFSAPQETVETWERDLQCVAELPVQHVSTYALTFEKGTRFWGQRLRGDLQTVDQEVEVEMYELMDELLEPAGFRRYEISNFAKNGHACRHNLAYWKGLGWYAAGPGAAKFAAGRREVNHRSTTTYLRRIESGQSPVAESESITVEQYGRERAAFGIRMLGGIDLEDLSTSCGMSLAQLFQQAIDRSLDDQLIDRLGAKLRLTKRGLLFADTVATRFLDSGGR